MPAIIPFISQLPDSQQLEWLAKLNSVLPEETFVLAKNIKAYDRSKCEIAIISNPSPDDLALFSNLKWVQSLRAGVENVIQPSIDHGFKLIRMVDPTLTETMAEAVLAWSLYQIGRAHV